MLATIKINVTFATSRLADRLRGQSLACLLDLFFRPLPAPARVCGSSGPLSKSAIPEELATKGQGIILYETD